MCARRHVCVNTRSQSDSSSEIALVYNDRSVLENFHVSTAFRLMKDDDCNILAGLKYDEYR